MVFFIFCMLYLQWIPGYGLVPCQVWKFQTLMSKPLDPVAIHHDAWGIKKLFSYSLRRTGSDSRYSLDDGTPNRRVPLLFNHGWW